MGAIAASSAIEISYSSMYMTSEAVAGRLLAPSLALARFISRLRRIAPAVLVSGHGFSHADQAGS
jgi:hypothetical protein